MHQLAINAGDDKTAIRRFWHFTEFLAPNHARSAAETLRQGLAHLGLLNFMAI
jgi:hypothetical protein